MSINIKAADTLLLVHQIAQIPSGNSWADKYDYYFTYDDSLKLTQRVQKLYNTNEMQYTFAYNQSGLLSVETAESWSSGGWVNKTERRYQYDSNRNMIGKRDFAWSSDSGWYEAGQRYTYTYDEDGNLLIETCWLNGTLWFTNTNTYDPLGKLLEMMSQNYSVNKTTKGTYTYNSEGLETEVTATQLNGDTWRNYSRTSTFYNSDGVKIQYNTFTWNETNTSWVNTQRRTYTYGANGELLTEKTSSWEQNAWKNILQFVNNYETFQTTAIVRDRFAMKPTMRQKTLEIFDILGRSLSTSGIQEKRLQCFQMTILKLENGTGQLNTRNHLSTK